MILLALALVGCSTRNPHDATLTPDQASALARRLANERSQALFACQPFQNGPTAHFVRGCWVWRDRRGRGLADMEATVKFARNGAKPCVTVELLDTGLDGALR